MATNKPEELEEALHDYLLIGAKEKKKESSIEKKEEKTAEIQEKIAKIQENTELKVAKQIVNQYEKIYYNTYVNKISGLKLEYWTKENNARKDKALKDQSEALEAKIKEIQTELQSKIDQYKFEVKFLTNCAQEYLPAWRKINPNKQKYPVEVWQTILTLAENKFDELKNEAQELLKKVQSMKLKSLKQVTLDFDVTAQTEKINQKIAEIPIKIEDKIQEIKDMLDGLLGKYLSPIMNPDSPDFNLDAVLAKIEGLLTPLTSAIAPLEAVAGPVPILGDLAGILSLLSSSSGGGKLSKEDLKKLIPVRPALPSNILDNAKGILDNIVTMCMQLPTICINVIFQMIDCIISLFNQIAGIIGVPSIPFPLSLVPDCISLMPKMLNFINAVPGLLYASVKGLLIDKMTEAMALSVPKPNVDLATLESLIPEVEDSEANTPSAKSKPPTKNKEYREVITDKLKELDNLDLGLFKSYSRTDLSRILAAYKEIYNGSGGTVNKYEAFSGDTKTQTLFPSTVSSITRSQGTPEDFEDKLKTIFGVGMKQLQEGVVYDNIKKTSQVTGGALYEMYKDQIKDKEPNDQVVLPTKLKP